MRNWQAAIDYYENLIQNPPTFADSIYAIIDLGHLYLMIEADSSSKSVMGMGSMPEHLPGTKEEFRGKQEYLLSLLPQFKTEHQIQNKRYSNEISQNSPNPFADITNIEILLKKPANLQIKVMDINGRTVRILQFEEEEGKHQIKLDMTNEPAGFYCYSVFVNGTYIETKKMILVN